MLHLIEEKAKGCEVPCLYKTMKVKNKMSAHLLLSKPAIVEAGETWGSCLNTDNREFFFTCEEAIRLIHGQRTHRKALKEIGTAFLANIFQATVVDAGREQGVDTQCPGLHELPAEYIQWLLAEAEPRAWWTIDPTPQNTLYVPLPS